MKPQITAGRLAELLHFWEFLGFDPDFLSRWQARAPRSQGGQGAGLPGCAVMFAGAASVAAQQATADRQQALYQRVAAMGGKRIDAETPSSKRQADSVRAWTRKI